MLQIKQLPIKSSLVSFLIVTGSLAHAQTPITALPFNITAPGTYVLDSSLTYSNASNSAAIQINASNVTIDLNGNYLSNIPAGTSTQAIGIAANNRANLTIKNGLIVGFSAGIILTGPGTNTNSRIENVRFIFNINSGVMLKYSRNGIIMNCQFSSTGFSSSGTALNSNSVGIFDEASLGGNLISNNVISQGSGFGILLGSNDLADNNLIVDCPIGIDGNNNLSSKEKNNTVTGSAPGDSYLGGNQLFNNF